MRSKTSILCGLALALAACSHFGKKEPEQTPEQKAQAARQSAATGAADAVREFQESKAKYVSKSENTIADLESKIAAYRAKAPDDPARRESHMNTVTSLEQNLAVAKTRLDSVKAASVDGWDQAQRELEQQLLTTRAAYGAAAETAH